MRADILRSFRTRGESTMYFHPIKDLLRKERKGEFLDFYEKKRLKEYANEQRKKKNK
jgi:hypothetical protein